MILVTSTLGFPKTICATLARKLALYALNKIIRLHVSSLTKHELSRVYLFWAPFNPSKQRVLQRSAKLSSKKGNLVADFLIEILQFWKVIIKKGKSAYFELHLPIAKRSLKAIVELERLYLNLFQNKMNVTSIRGIIKSIRKASN